MLCEPRSAAPESDGPGRESGRMSLTHRSDVWTRRRFLLDSDRAPSAVGRSAHPGFGCDFTPNGGKDDLQSAGFPSGVGLLSQHEP
jgi:hypothetical protein